MYRIKKAAVAIYGWDRPLLTFIYPGIDCGSIEVKSLYIRGGHIPLGEGPKPKNGLPDGVNRISTGFTMAWGLKPLGPPASHCLGFTPRVNR